MMEMRGHQDKEIKKMPTRTTLGYNLPNRDSSSSSPSPTVVAAQAQAHTHTHTLVFNNPPPPPQNSTNHRIYQTPPPPPLVAPPQPQRPTTDPDLSSSSPVTTVTTAAEAEETRSKTWYYRECLRNHAASMGSHVLDGCGEFMPSGEEGTPESLKCAACECHRNFHRKHLQGEQPQHVLNYQSYYPNNNNNKHNNNNGHLHFPTPPSLSLPQHHHHHRFSSHVLPAGGGGGPVVPPLMMAFGGGPAESSSEDLNNMFQCNNAAATQLQPLSKKRFRTKFSQQQKDRMMEFAEKIGWKIQKHDEQEVQQFCSQLGIRRQVFKVWMHNNKQAMMKKQQV